MVRKFSPLCWAGWKWGTIKLCRAGTKTPIFGPTLPTSLSSLHEHESKLFDREKLKAGVNFTLSWGSSNINCTLSHLITNANNILVINQIINVQYNILKYLPRICVIYSINSITPFYKPCSCSIVVCRYIISNSMRMK